MERSNNFFSNLIKGVLTTVIITLLSVLIFAGVVKFAVLNSNVIKAVNQFIKIISIFLGTVFCVHGKMGLIKGILIGLIATIITYLIFALFGGELALKSKLIIDLIFTSVVGAISGIVAVNIRK